MKLILDIKGKFETCIRPGLPKVGYLRTLGDISCKRGEDIRPLFKIYTRYSGVMKNKNRFITVFWETLLKKAIAFLISSTGV